MREIKVNQCSHQRVPSVSLITRRACRPLKDDEAALHLHEDRSSLDQLTMRVLIVGHAEVLYWVAPALLLRLAVGDGSGGTVALTPRFTCSGIVRIRLQCSYPNWSLLTYCKRGFRCCRLPTPQIHRRKSAGSRSEIALPRGATVPSFHTPPSFLSPDVELLHPVRFRMQMTSLKASSPACSLLHRAPLRRGPPREMLRAFVSEAAWKQRWTPRELSVLSGAEIPPILRAKLGWTPQLTAPQTLCASGLSGLPSRSVEDDWMTRFLGNHLTRLPALSNGINLWMNRGCYRDAHYVFSATVLECLVDTVGE